jgi:hypothetical protein
MRFVLELARQEDVLSAFHSFLLFGFGMKRKPYSEAELQRLIVEINRMYAARPPLQLIIRDCRGTVPEALAHVVEVLGQWAPDVDFRSALEQWKQQSTSPAAAK